MTYRLSDEDLARADELDAGATPGPWGVLFVGGSRAPDDPPSGASVDFGEGIGAVDFGPALPDAEFAAFARSALPALVAEVREHRAREARRAAFVEGAEWQAARDAERLAELEAEVERLREPGRIAAAVAAVTPCSCSAQRARAEAAEAKLARVRDEVEANSFTVPSNAGEDTLVYADVILAALDETEATT